MARICIRFRISFLLKFFPNDILGKLMKRIERFLFRSHVAHITIVEGWGSVGPPAITRVKVIIFLLFMFLLLYIFPINGKFFWDKWNFFSLPLSILQKNIELSCVSFRWGTVKQKKFTTSKVRELTVKTDFAHQMF